jgi:hypothetical protein
MSGNNFLNPKHARAKRNVVIGGGAIIFCITLLSCVSSFMIYREGFADMGPRFQNLLSVFAVVVVEGAFIWLVYGFTKAFSSFLERAISFGAMWAIATVMLINIVTHFMMVKGIPLNEFQQAWLAWGAVAVFIGVLVIVLAITLADPVIRLIRLELKVWGMQQETVLRAQKSSLESERVKTAIENRADSEAERLARRIEGEANDVKGELGGDHIWQKTGSGWKLQKVDKE